ncbi:MAG: HPr family phosphocarrier protein [Oscillospiraceae bacterium]
MVKEIKLHGVNDIKALNKIATSYPSEVGIHNEDTIVDAKSLLGLMTLDFSKPILCVTEDEYFYKRIKNFLA